MSSTRRVNVDLGDRTYPIHIGRDILRQGLEAFSSRRTYIISDKNVASHYLKATKDALGHNCIGSSVIPPGESSKSLSMAEKIFGDLLEAKADRKTLIIALGGGVVGDLAGFIASTFMREIPFVQVPTTLLAMVDSSVGGKVAVNHPKGKNMIGRFFQPEAVIMSWDVLETLNPRELRAGLAEVIKYGIIMDSSFFDWIEANIDRLLSLNGEAITEALERSVKCKAEVVAQDEKEGGLRAILNLGHTFGHAEEVLSGYGTVLHGEAVAAGMVAAMRCSVSFNQATQNDLNRVEKIISHCDLPTELNTWVRTDDFWTAMEGDKKSEAGVVNFVFSKGIGDCELPRPIDRTTIENVLNPNKAITP